jgi:hypothetical protein
MGYFQDVVSEYLRANRATFINTECCIQLNPGNPDTGGPHWFCDAVAINLQQQTAHLCEVTYAKRPSALITRLRAWSANWSDILIALERDCGIPHTWNVKPWVFIPRDVIKTLEQSLTGIVGREMPRPEVTALEDVVPWKYPSWDRKVAESQAPSTEVQP